MKIMGWIALVVALLGLVLAVLSSSRRATARVDKGPVGERIVARAAVTPGAGLVRVYAAADARVRRVVVREGERVEAGAVLAELEVAGQRQDLRAPARAIVLERHVEVGDYVVSAEHGAQQPCFELADPEKTELRIEIEETDAPRIAAGQGVQIKPIGFALSVAQGRVERVSARLEARSIGAEDARVRAGGKVRAAVVSWTSARPDWPIGTRAEATLELRRKDAAARVPRSALSVREGRTIVKQPVALWTRDVPVEVLSADEAFAEISGLPVGSEIVVP